MAERKLRVEIAGDASKFERTLSDVNGKVGSWASGLTKVMTAGLAAAGAAGGAALAAGVLGALEQGAASDKVAARLGLSADESERLGKIAGDIYAGAWGESFEQVSETAGRVMTDLNVSMNDVDFTTITTGVLDIATAFDVDVNDAVRTASALLTNGLAPDAQSALDIVTKGLQTTGIRGDDLLETFEEYSNQFASMGIDGPAALDFIVKALDNGARSSDGAADAIKELYLRITEDSDGPNQALADLGLEADDLRQAIADGGPAAQEAYRQVFEAIGQVEDPTERARLAQELLGGTFEQVGLDAITGMGTATGAVEGLEGATAAMGETLNDNLGTKLEQIKRTVLQALVEFVEDKLIPALEKLADFGVTIADKWRDSGLQEAFERVREVAVEAFQAIVDKLGELADWFGEHEDITRALVIGLGAIAVTLGTVAVAFGIASAAAAVFAALTAPITLVALAIGALAAGAVYLYQRFETVRTVVDGVARFFRDDFIPLMQDVGERVAEAARVIADIWTTYVQPIITNAIETIIGVIEGIVEAVGGVVDLLVGIFTGDWSRAWDGAKAIVSGIWDALFALVSGVVGHVEGVINILKAIFEGAWSVAWGVAKTVVETALGLVEDAINAVETVFNAVKDAIKAVVDDSWTKAWDAAKAVVEAAVAIIETAINGIVTVVETVTSTVVTLFEAIKDPVGTAGAAAGTLFGSNLADEIEKERTNAVGKAIGDMIVTLSIAGTAGALGAAAGSAFGSALAGSIRNTVGLVGRAVDTVRSVLGGGGIPRGTPVGGFPVGFPTGGIVTERSGPRYAADGHRLVGALPGEMILNKSQQSRLFAMANGRGGGGAPINVTVNVTAVGSPEELGDIVADALWTKVQTSGTGSMPALTG